MDPARRSEGKKVFKLEDCAPNLLDIVPKCLEIAPRILVKLSPLIDISLLLKMLSPNFIWVVGVKNEVKEVLCLIESKLKTCKIEAVMLNGGLQQEEFKFFRKQEKEAISQFSLPLKYIYEPNAAIMKAGAFKLIGNHYGLYKLHQHTHLYTSNEQINEFPGRIFLVKQELRINKEEIQRLIPGKKINVISRNHPLSAEKIKKKLGLKDGGADFLIASRLLDESKPLLHCSLLV